MHEYTQNRSTSAVSVTGVLSLVHFRGAHAIFDATKLLASCLGRIPSSQPEGLNKPHRRKYLRPPRHITNGKQTAQGATQPRRTPTSSPCSHSPRAPRPRFLPPRALPKARRPPRRQQGRRPVRGRRGVARASSVGEGGGDPALGGAWGSFVRPQPWTGRGGRRWWWTPARSASTSSGTSRSSGGRW
jgi:hypothetical protein